MDQFLLTSRSLIEGHTAKRWQNPTAVCTLLHQWALPNDTSPHVGRAPLAVLVCTFTFNYKAQQRVVVCMRAPVGMEASQVVDA